MENSLQGGEAYNLNRKLRLITSDFGGAIGQSSFSTPMDVAFSIAGIKTKTFAKDSKEKKNFKCQEDRGNFMIQHFAKTEPAAREWYSRTRNVRIKQVGLIVPKWEPRIAAVLSGEVLSEPEARGESGTRGENGERGESGTKGENEGMIVIKCPLEMYGPLRDHITKINSGWRPRPFYHEHIWESHYAQIQGNMKIAGKKWCDYIVYATSSNLVYVERVLFDQGYWDLTLWPEIKSFLDTVLEPLIDSVRES